LRFDDTPTCFDRFKIDAKSAFQEALLAEQIRHAFQPQRSQGIRLTLVIEQVSEGTGQF
jgi:hypothetical protein